ncbi:unnamed protein product [Peronospora destructor]|uniref:Uncharacterized protein n=1 Tax=Peronospora destructor TaxID=86335 RepID=A0AAV0TPT6_9STRA|nr:unnamed protein product [Peronospora destructor]
MFELSTFKDEFASAYKLEIDAGTTADVDLNGLTIGALVQWIPGFLWRLRSQWFLGLSLSWSLCGSDYGATGVNAL